MTRDEIALEACCASSTLRTADYMQTLRREGLVHIHSWLRNSPGPHSPVYAVGPGRDAKPPRNKTSAERSRAWKTRTQYNRRHADALRILNQLIEGKA